MKVSVVISACDNREHLFARALDTWNKQTLPKSEWEIIIVDDEQRETLRKQCCIAASSMGISLRFIRIDKSKSFYPVRSFIPVLTNNVGFRQARGDVIVVTGPETLQERTNLAIASEMISRQECAYGLVFRASPSATDYIGKGWDKLKQRTIKDLLQIPGTTQKCLTRPPHPPAYWYFMAVAKKYIEIIGGVDERFLGGLCAEDDDFSNRMQMSGIKPVFENKILGIHQNHSREDYDDGVHINRKEGEGLILRKHNIMLMKDTITTKKFSANQSHEWGNSELIVLDEKY